MGENAASEVALEFGDDEAGKACAVTSLLHLREEGSSGERERSRARASGPVHGADTVHRSEQTVSRPSAPLRPLGVSGITNQAKLMV